MADTDYGIGHFGVTKKQYQNEELTEEEMRILNSSTIKSVICQVISLGYPL